MLDGHVKTAFVLSLVLAFLLEMGIAFASVALPEHCSTVSGDSGQGCAIYSGKVGRNQFGLITVGVLSLVCAAIVLYAVYGLGDRMPGSSQKWFPVVMLVALLGLSSATIGLTMNLKGQCKDASDQSAVDGISNANIAIYVIVWVVVLAAAFLVYKDMKNNTNNAGFPETGENPFEYVPDRQNSQLSDDEVYV